MLGFANMHMTRIGAVLMALLCSNITLKKKSTKTHNKDSIYRYYIVWMVDNRSFGEGM